MTARASLVCIVGVGVMAMSSSAQEVLYTLASPNEEDYGGFGSSVSGAGDINGDGYGDVVVGAGWESPGDSPWNAGRAYLFDGQTGILLQTLVSPDEVCWGCFGWSVSGAGDVNGDGYSDVVVGAPGEGPTPGLHDAGRAYVFDGQTGSLLHSLVSPNEERSGSFGISVSRVGDVNRDGYDDIVVGADGEDPGGRAYVFDGRTGGLLCSLLSPNEGGGFGHSVSGAGDVNGDGHDDIVVGSPFESPEASLECAGRAYIFEGQTGVLLQTLVSPNEQEWGGFGWAVSGAGDVNGNGYHYVMVGTCGESPGTSPDCAGRAYVFDGQTGILLHTLVSPNEEREGYFGISVSGAGDVNGDGYDDVAVGASREDSGSSPWEAGRVYVFEGRTGNLFHTLVSPNEEVGGDFGYRVSGAGDVNGDGYDDVVVGALGESPGSSLGNAGRAYVFDCHVVPAEPGILEATVAGLELVGPCPNPTTNHAEIRLRIPEGGQRIVDLSLYDVSGHLIERVLNRSVQGGNTVNLHWIPESMIASGVFWWRLSSGEQSVEKAMVIVR